MTRSLDSLPHIHTAALPERVRSAVVVPPRRPVSRSASLRRGLVTGLLLSGSALAVSNQVAWLTTDPRTQTAYVDLDADLGYPIGAKKLVLTVDCPRAALKVTVQGDSHLPFDPAQWKADPAVLKALLSTGLLLQKPGSTVLVNPETKERLGLNCTNSVLSVDYSRMNGIGFEGEIQGPFSRHASDPGIDMDYALSVRPRTKLANYTVQVRVQPVAGGLGLTRLQVDFDIADWVAKAQVFMSDGAYLYPIFYGGQQQQNARLDALVLKNQIQFYASDDPSQGGWRKTTYDYKTQILTTVPVSKPTLPIRQ